MQENKKNKSIGYSNTCFIGKLQMDFHEFASSLVLALESKDIYTAGHSERVADITSDIAKAIGMDKWDIEYLHIAAHLHDIGKIGIPDGILLKSGPLTKAEYEVVKQHSSIGYKILKDVKGLEDIAKIIRHHHERFDGKGYPDGLKGKDIPLGSRIIALADSFDAMTRPRPYRKAKTEQEALKEIAENRGTQFDLELADAFLSTYNNRDKAVSF
jgi:putative nucleotidyltransferase with HDIG domain